MDLQAHYDTMRQAARQQLAQGAADLDPLLDSPHDSRRGITLLARPPANILQALGELLLDFQQAEPDQYYYPLADIHLTILSIISCYQGFALGLIEPAHYCTLLGEVLRQAQPFTVRFAGLTASPGGIIVQGFPVGSGLQTLRDALRRAFRQSGLQQSIDARYNIQTAHSTIIRFRHPLRDTAYLLRKLAAYEHYPIGTFEVNTLELVYNDWYQRQTNTILLEKYALMAS